MKNIFETLRTQFENDGYSFKEAERIVDHLGRSRVRKKLLIEKGVRGKDTQRVIDALIDPYNSWVRSEAETEIEAELAAEQAKIEAEKAAAAEKLAAYEAELKAKEEELQNEKAAIRAEYEAKEEARKKPIFKITAWVGLTLTFLVAVVLVGLNFFNAKYFLGANLHWSVLLTFALLFGGSFVYFALSRNSKALWWVTSIIPFDLVIATVVKPYLGDTANLAIKVGESLQWGAIVALVMFLAVYGTQLYHVGVAVTRLLNPRELTTKEEIEHNEKVLNSIQ